MSLVLPNFSRLPSITRNTTRTQRQSSKVAETLDHYLQTVLLQSLAKSSVRGLSLIRLATAL